MQKNKLLLHTCCGPCFLGVWEDLADSEFEVTNFFYNPNIWPEKEYKKRALNLKKVANQTKTKIIQPGYDPKSHAEAISGIEDSFPKRCFDCYRLRLEKTAGFAANNDYDAFSTTLLISPYQQHETLKEIGEQIALRYDIKFVYRDWRPNFRKSQGLARDSGVYRQKYCGCRYSAQNTQASTKGV